MELSLTGGKRQFLRFIGVTSKVNTSTGPGLPSNGFKVCVPAARTRYSPDELGDMAFTERTLQCYENVHVISRLNETRKSDDLVAGYRYSPLARSHHGRNAAGRDAHGASLDSVMGSFSLT